MMFLFRHCIEWAIDRGYRTLDLGLGMDQEKLRWGAEPRPVVWLTLASPRPRSNASFLAFRLFRTLRDPSLAEVARRVPAEVLHALPTPPLSRFSLRSLPLVGRLAPGWRGNQNAPGANQTDQDEAARRPSDHRGFFGIPSAAHDLADSATSNLLLRCAQEEHSLAGLGNLAAALALL
jgi:hypothetical protein